eukprot:tig00020556_g11012.t1
MRISPAVLGILIVPFVLLFVAVSFVPATKPERASQKDFLSATDATSFSESGYEDSGASQGQSLTRQGQFGKQSSSARFETDGSFGTQPARQAASGWGGGGGVAAGAQTRSAGGGAGGRAPGLVDEEYYQRELATCRHELNMRLADSEGSPGSSGVQETLQRKEGQISVLKAIRHAFARKLDLRCPYVRDYRVPSTPGKQKLQVLRDYAKKHGLKTFLEVGTYQGETLFGMMQSMDDLHSIELSPYYYQSAATLFANVRKVRLYQGDSASILPSVLAQLRQPALFWLDAHYTTAEKAVRGAGEAPVILDLLSIFEWPYAQQSVVVIDDAHLFVGYDACSTAAGSQCFPSVRDIAELVCAHYPELSLQVENDAIRIFKALPQQAKSGGLSSLLKGGSPKAPAKGAPAAGASQGAPAAGAGQGASQGGKWGQQGQQAQQAAPKSSGQQQPQQQQPQQPQQQQQQQQQRAAGGQGAVRGGGAAAGGSKQGAAAGRSQQPAAAGGKYRPPGN